MNGFDPVYGARPLRRLVQSAIGDQLAKELLAGEVREGDTVRVDLDPTGRGRHRRTGRRPRPAGGRPVTARRRPDGAPTRARASGVSGSRSQILIEARSMVPRNV